MANNAGGNEVCRVNSKYGAPMGRADAGTIDFTRTLYLRRVAVDAQGYDKGGAYWGLGKPVYAYGDGHGWRYIRAFTRDDAKRKVRDTNCYAWAKFWN